MSRKRLIYLVFAAAGALEAPFGEAQVFNPTVLAPSAKPPPGRELSTSVARRGLEKPPDADKTIVAISRVTIDGAFPEMGEANRAFENKLRGKRLSVAQIYAAAEELQVAYSKAYPLATVALAKLSSPRGEVTVSVGDGYIQKLDLSRVPEQTRELIKARLESLVGRRHLTLEEYQRRTLLIGGLAGVSGQTATMPSNVLDGNVLVVTIIENRLSSSAVISNRLPKEIGTWEFSKSAALNNAFGFGEQVSISGSTSSDFDRMFDGTGKSEAISGDFTTPIGADGLAAGAGYLRAHSRPTPLPYALSPMLLDGGDRATSSFDRAYARIAYPWLLASDHSLKSQASFEHVDLASNSPVGAFFEGNAFYSHTHDRYNVFRVATEGIYRFPWGEGGAVYATVFYSRGLGGRTADGSLFLGVPLTRPYAEPTFNRLAFRARLDLNLPEEFRLSVIGRGQTSFGQPLVIAENLTLDGFEAVSGYASGTINVDRGATVRAEFTRPFAIELLGYNHLVAPYIFGAWGSGVHERPLPVERKRVWAETFGGGVRTDTAFTGSPYGESLSIEFGRDFSNLLFRESGYRTNVTFNVRYAGDPFIASPAKDVAHSSAQISWDGLYAGLTSGYVWDPRPQVATVGAPIATGIDSLLDLSPEFYALSSASGVKGSSLAAGGGFIGGGEIGYNLQSEKFVLGVEADVQGTNPRTRHGVTNNDIPLTEFLSDGSAYSDVATTAIHHSKNVAWLGTVRGRAGYLLAPTLLAYADGGFAYGKVTANSFIEQIWSGNGPLGSSLQSSGSVGALSAGRAGWTYGVGLEWMFAPNASLKAEYLHFDLGSARYSMTPLLTYYASGPFTNGVIPFARTQFRGDIARVGLNYHFRDNGVTAPAASSSTMSRGFYAGLNAGYTLDANAAFSTVAIPRSDRFDQATFATVGGAAASSATGASSVAANGAIGGGQGGYNYISDSYLVGLEADFQGASARGTRGFTGMQPAAIAGVLTGHSGTSLTATKTLDWLASLRCRVGYLLTPSLLGYATGGFATGGVTAQNWVTHLTTIGITDLQSAGNSGHLATTRVGWVIGGGLEWMFSPAVSLKAEYLFYDLGQVRYNSGSITDALAVRESAQTPPVFIANAASLVSAAPTAGHIARLGLNYHFDPVAAFPLLAEK